MEQATQLTLIRQPEPAPLSAGFRHVAAPRCLVMAAGRRLCGALRAAGEQWRIDFEEDAAPDLHVLATVQQFDLSTACHPDERREAAPASVRIQQFTLLPDEHAVVFETQRSITLPFERPLPALLRLSTVFQSCLGASVIGGGPFALSLEVDDPAGLVLPGVQLKLTVTPRWGASVVLELVVTACGPAARRVHISARPLRRQDQRLAGMLAAAACDHYSLWHLRHDGLRPRAVSRWLSASLVSSPADMEAVLQLRRLANQAFGRLCSEMDPHAWRDELDDSSINLLVRLGDRPVATGRLVINSGRRELCEIACETELPDPLWQAGFIEVSRLAVHPDFRKTPATLMLFREAGRLALERDCRYLLLDAIEKLVPVYRKIGAEPLNLTKKHPYSNEMVHVMSIDVRRSLTAIDLKLPFWLYVFGPALAFHHRAFGERHLRRIIGGKPSPGAAIKRWLARLT